MIRPLIAAGLALTGLTTPGHHVVKLQHEQSSNWSGYVETGHFDRVATTFVIPEPTTLGTSAEQVSEWAGIDGDTNSDLIQAGVDETGGTQYETPWVWWEILPSVAQNVPITAHYGNVVRVVITQETAATWQIFVADRTTGVTWSHDVIYKGPATSAEWVEEVPSHGTGPGAAQWAPLSLPPVKFYNDSATGTVTSLSDITMETQGSHVPEYSPTVVQGPGQLFTYGFTVVDDE